MRDKVEIKTEFHPKNAYRGQISGVRLSGEISSALPSELALSKNPRTKLYFAQKVADLSHFEKSNGLNVLVQFLRKSFNGGTDASPALEKSLELLSANDWKNADVLVVSDMVMGSFSAELEARIKAQQKKESTFYSLVIGSSGNKNVIDIFDENWSYNTSDSHAMRHLVKNIAAI